MKKYLLGICVLVYLLAACKEEELTPSYADKDRVAELADMSKPLVARLVNNFNCGLLYNYDENIDFRYVAESNSVSDRWNQVNIPKIEEINFFDTNGNPISYELRFPDRTETVSSFDEYLDAALNFMDSTLFTYFDATKEVAKYFPPKVLLSSKISNGTNMTVSYLKETDSRISDDLQGRNVRSMYNRNSIVFSGNMVDIAPGYQKFKNENLYVFILRMMETNNWCSSIMPDSLFDAVEMYYGDTIGYEYGSKPPYGVTSADRIPNNWYHEKGFIDSYYITKKEVVYTSLGTPYVTNSNGFGTKREIFSKHMFPATREEDFKAFLNEFIHRPADDTEYTVGWKNLSEPVKNRAKGFIQFFASLGIDFIAINPDLSVLL